MKPKTRPKREVQEVLEQQYADMVPMLADVVEAIHEKAKTQEELTSIPNLVGYVLNVRKFKPGNQRTLLFKAICSELGLRAAQRKAAIAAKLAALEPEPEPQLTLFEIR